MSKPLGLLLITLIPFAANAQANRVNDEEMEIIRICFVLVSAALLIVFILGILKRFFDYRLKDRIVEKGIPETMASTILQTSVVENRNANIKWFAILVGIGVGLTIVNYTRPLGLHSLAIVAFSLAASFLGYLFFLKQSSK